MPQSLRNAVVVITGASSGIGRCAARMFAARGSTVVIAARREIALREAQRECEMAGGRALVVPTDVTDEQQVKDLAARAIESYGRIDVWVNNAAVSLFGRLEQAPPEIYDRVIHTNLFGYVYGARAAIPCFREQEHGVLINNASVVSYVGQPYTSAYMASKHAIRGLGTDGGTRYPCGNRAAGKYRHAIVSACRQLYGPRCETDGTRLSC